MLALMITTTVRAQYQVESWTTDNGLPQNTVDSIVQTPDGYLWLATLDGLVRYDGVRFTVFNKNNSPGIESNRFKRMVIDGHGDLWVGTEIGAVTRYHDGRFQSYFVNEVTREPIYSLTINGAGEPIVLGTENKVRWNGEEFIPNQRFAGETKNSVQLYSRSGAFWYSSEQTVHRIKDQRATDFRLPALPKDTITGMLEDARGRIWIGTISSGLFVLENERLTAFATKEGWSKAHVTPRLIDHLGNLWASSNEGVVIISSEGKIDHLTTEQGLSDNFTNPIFEDREGGIWIGTLKRGLNHLTRQSVAFYGTQDGLAADVVEPIYETRGGTIWIGGKGLTRFHDGKFLAAVKENPAGEVTAIEEDKSGRMWFGYWSGIYYLDNGHIINFNNKLGASPTVMDIHADRTGTMWFASNEGVFHWQANAMTKFTTANGLASDDARVIHESANGTIWIGTYGGLSEFNDGAFKSFTTKEGLASNLVRSLYEDADGVLWIGSYDGGLTRFKDGKFTRYTSNDGLFNDGVFQILEDDGKNIWMSCNRGIYRVNKQHLNDFADGKITRIESIALSKADGLRETECNGGQQPAGIRARDGKLWFPTQRGVAVIDPQKIKINPFAPPVILESIKIDNELTSGFKANYFVEILPGKNNLEIAYTGLSFVKSEFVKFRYKLDGIDKDWVAADTRRTAYYSYLPPGEYVFTVIAANSDGVWNEHGAQVKIVVLAPFYRTWWFIALAIGVSFVLVALYFQRRLVRLELARNAQEEFARRLIESQERERTRIAAELHDGLSQSLVIIKNRAVLSLTAPDDVERAFEQMEEISQAATEAMFEAKEIIYDLRPIQLDRFGLTKAIKAMLKKVGDAHELELTADIEQLDETLSKEAESNLYRILQEAINNVVRHSKATAAQVSLQRRSDFVTMTIQDNGTGFQTSETARKEQHNENQNGGFGLLGIVERARLLSGHAEIHSTLGSGTTITISLPVKGNSFASKVVQS
jgi:signal transduction histidine kinase/ligand-binding sensor domain-containing protein